MEARCHFCKKRIKHDEDYTSINKGIYSEEGDNDWIALIFHEACLAKFGKKTKGRLAEIFETEL
ncbi:MAG: hypothetical protein KGJ59_03970 [Bacteroidota bacterium]|nr:hypothetical protein [Bacteroidota bacterium]